MEQYTEYVIIVYPDSKEIPMPDDPDVRGVSVYYGQDSDEVRDIIDVIMWSVGIDPATEEGMRELDERVIVRPIGRGIQTRKFI